MTTRKMIPLTRWTFVSKIMSLLLNMLFVKAFLRRRKRLLISWLWSPSAVILEPKKIKSAHCFHCLTTEEELKSLLMKVKDESEKVGLKPNIQKMKIMASDPITSWEIDGETVETVADFIVGGSKITADGDCSHEIKKRLLLGRKL